MSYTLNINGQDYIFETGAGGYTYYRVASNQRFGKKVKAKNGSLLVWSGTDGTPNPDIGLNNISFGRGKEYNINTISSDAFIFTIKVPTDYSSNEFRIFTVSGYQYECVVNWGDGNIEIMSGYDDPKWIHTYESINIGNEYQVSITGLFEYILYDTLYVNDMGASWIYSVDSLGSVGMVSLMQSFDYCINMIEFNSGNCDTSTVEDFYGMCNNAINLINVDLSTLNIENMSFTDSISHMFYDSYIIPLENYNAMLINFANQDVLENVSFNDQTATGAGLIAKNYLTNIKHWFTMPS